MLHDTPFVSNIFQGEVHLTNVNRDLKSLITNFTDSPGQVKHHDTIQQDSVSLSPFRLACGSLCFLEDMGLVHPAKRSRTNRSGIEKTGGRRWFSGRSTIASCTSCDVRFYDLMRRKAFQIGRHKMFRAYNLLVLVGKRLQYFERDAHGRLLMI